MSSLLLNNLRRGDIYLVNFDPTIGAEIKKIRPAVVIQNDIGNKYSPVTIVAAITSRNTQGEIYPTEVLISKHTAHLDVDSIILLGQIRTIDKKRLIKKIGSIDNQTIDKVNSALLISLGLVEV